MPRFLQFTLSLFDTTPETPPVTQHPPVARRPRANQPPAGAVDVQPALDMWAPVVPGKPAPPQTQPGETPKSEACALPVQSLQEALAPVTFRHPRAARETMMDGALVAYAFVRGTRKTIGFSVGPEGLAVRAPKWVSLQEVDKAVREKSGWILNKLHETRQRHQRLEAARIDWRNGAKLDFMGQQVVVRLDSAHAFEGAGAALEGADDEGLPLLQLALPHTASAEQIRDLAQAWLMRQAKANFMERLDHYAPVVGVQWRKLSLSSAGTRWGSASADGSIRLNWRLIHFRQCVIDYVVVHELSHLRVMDHSPQFWDTVRAVVPDFAGLRAELKREPIPRW